MLCEPKISFEGTKKIVDTEDSECRKVEIVEDEELLQAIKNKELVFVKDIDDGLEVDLQKWIAPFDTCNVGLPPLTFFKDWVTKFSKDDYKTLRYSILKLTISLLETFSLEEDAKLEEMKAFYDKKFPEILVLMNINGCLCHRTKDKVNFINVPG